MDDKTLHLQCHYFEGKYYLMAQTLDNEITVFRQKYIMEPICINKVLYVECAVGDHVLINYKYRGNECSKRFKVIGKDSTGLFFICKSDPTKEEAVYLELMTIYNKVQEGKMGTDEAHEKADEAILNLLYEKKLDLIADVYLAIPKWYN